MDADGWIYGLAFYCASGVIGDQWAAVWGTGGNVLGIAKIINPLAAGDVWLRAWLRPRVRLFAGDVVRMGVQTGGGYKRNNGALTSGVQHGHITFLSSFQTTSLWPPGVTPTSNTNANGIDFLFSTSRNG